MFVFIESELSQNRSTSNVMWKSGDIDYIIYFHVILTLQKKCSDASMLPEQHKGMSVKFLRYIS